MVLIQVKIRKELEVNVNQPSIRSRQGRQAEEARSLIIRYKKIN